ncbi:phage head spike fiber domain-containing protein [Paracraurococcus ruber]|uniref:Minor tail protein n=1 Tax=Paracraurococcus ruber TaxID=77675 RepID=A0ABS1CRC2_9PROT|nr:hypothetical protein [Paracraurococcus ruber]MBK1656842.1 hypothetical protein [Paracraurococcus ruber]TDG33957.1 hypothetical protein E2C05_01570 [Paracraurococcus ruber]
MPIVAFPAAIRNPNSIRFGLAANTQSGGRSPFDGTEQTLALPGAKWAAEVRWNTLPEAQWRIMQAFLAGLRGRAGRFTWGPTHMPRKGDGGADSVGRRVLSGSQTGGTLLVTGFDGGSFAFRAGDIFGWTGPDGRPQLRMVTDDVAMTDRTSTNLLLQSNALDNAAWTKSGTITATANTSAGPLGPTTADTLTCTSTSGGFASQARTITAGATYTFSAWLKAGTMGWAYIQLSNAGQTNGIRQWVNLSTGALGTTSTLGTATLVDVQTRSVAGGWYRFWVTCVVDSSTTSAVSWIVPVTANGGSAQTSSGTILTGGAQLEAGAVTLYIDTTTATVTRTQSLAVPITPDIRRSPNADTPLELLAPKAVWMVTDDQLGMEYERGVFASTTLQMEEALF